MRFGSLAGRPSPHIAARLPHRQAKQLPSLPPPWLPWRRILTLEEGLGGVEDGCGCGGGTRGLTGRLPAFLSGLHGDQMRVILSSARLIVTSPLLSFPPTPLFAFIFQPISWVQAKSLNSRKEVEDWDTVTSYRRKYTWIRDRRNKLRAKRKPKEIFWAGWKRFVNFSL